MTRDDIIRMARHVGICDGPFEFQMVSPEDLRRFAKLVSAAEREACAKVCEALKSKAINSQYGNDDELSNVMLRQIAHLGHAECAAAIRARSTP